MTLLAVIFTGIVGVFIGLWVASKPGISRDVLSTPDSQVLLGKLEQIERKIAAAQLGRLDGPVEHRPVDDGDPLHIAHRLAGECQRMLVFRPLEDGPRLTPMQRAIDAALGPNEIEGDEVDDEAELATLIPLNAEVYLDGPWPMICYDPPDASDEALRALDARGILKRVRAARALGLVVTSIDWLDRHPEEVGLVPPIDLPVADENAGYLEFEPKPGSRPHAVPNPELTNLSVAAFATGEFGPGEIEDGPVQAIVERQSMRNAALLDTELQMLVADGWPHESIMIECERGDRPRATVTAGTMHPESGQSWQGFWGPAVELATDARADDDEPDE